MIAVRYQANQLKSGRLARLAATVRQRTLLHGAMAAGMKEVWEDHTIMLARTRHATARALGAKQTGFYARAINTITATATQRQAAVSSDHPGFARAKGDVIIRPTGGRKFLSLPVNRMAYGHSPREFADRHPFFFHGKRGGLFFGYVAGNYRLVTLFEMTRSVTQDQDKTQMPTDRQMQDGAAAAVKELISQQLS